MPTVTSSMSQHEGLSTTLLAAAPVVCQCSALAALPLLVMCHRKSWPASRRRRSALPPPPLTMSWQQTPSWQRWVANHAAATAAWLICWAAASRSWCACLQLCHRWELMPAWLPCLILGVLLQQPAAVAHAAPSIAAALSPCRRRLTRRSRRTTSWCRELRAHLAHDCCWSAERGGGAPPRAAHDTAQRRRSMSRLPRPRSPSALLLQHRLGQRGTLASLPRAAVHRRGPEARPPRPRAARLMPVFRTCNTMNDANRVSWELGSKS